MNPELLPVIISSMAGLSKTGYIILGAALALVFMHFRDYRLSNTTKSFKSYLFSNPKKFDETLMTLFAILMAEGFLDTLAGLSIDQLITTGIALGVAVKRKVEGS